MELEKVDVCEYVESFREAAESARSDAVRMELKNLCGCVESLECESARTQELVSELREVERALKACNTDSPTAEACDAFFSRVEQAISHCQEI